MVFAAPQRRSLARLGVLAPTPITLRPATMATAPFGRICCSSAPVASRLGVLAPMPISLRPAPCGLTSWGRNASGGGGCRTANTAVRLFGGTTSLHSTAPHIADESEPRSESSGARRASPAANLRVYRTPHSISRHACAHANHLRPAGLGTAPFGQIGCSSAPVACATRRTCAHANHLRPAGLVLGGAM